MNHVLKLVGGGLPEQLASYGDPTLPVARRCSMVWRRTYSPTPEGYALGRCFDTLSAATVICRPERSEG